ncbi:MAG TPA: HAMP domain-containing sensor histidine kinase [Chitinophagaceae bacterium]
MQTMKITTFHQRKNTETMQENTDAQPQQKTVCAVVHEIRNPLTSIRLSNEMLLNACDEKEPDIEMIRPYLQIINKNIERIEAHMKSLLCHQARPHQFATDDVCECISKAVAQADDRLFLSKVTLHKDYRSGHMINGDVDKLTMAFLNIIVNSIEAMTTTNGKIWITVYEANNTIRITFKDNGAGMSAYVLSKVFEPNFSKKSAGLGMGLFNVKEIMKAHNAFIAMDSLPDVGTSVSILFNAVKTKLNNNPGNQPS